MNMLVLPAATFALLTVALVWCTRSLIRDNRADTLASVPVTNEQEIRLAAGGNVVVLMEVPRTATDFRSFEIQLVNKTTRQALQLKYSLGMGQESVYGVTTMKVPFGGFPAAPDSVYSARITGLQPGKDYSDYRLMFSRPYLARMARQIIGIVICGVGMLLSILWAAWLAGALHGDMP
jgi:hypothetical protein